MEDMAAGKGRAGAADQEKKLSVVIDHKRFAVGSGQADFVAGFKRKGITRANSPRNIFNKFAFFKGRGGNANIKEEFAAFGRIGGHGISSNDFLRGFRQI